MAVYGDLTYDSRVQREANALARAGHRVTVACLAARREEMGSLEAGVRLVVRAPGLSGVVPGASNPHSGFARVGLLGRLLKLRWVLAYGANVVAWGWLIRKACGRVDVWHAHDLPAYLALATHLRPATPVVYDVHDLFLETGTGLRLPGVLRLLLRRLEGRLARRARFLVTVNHGLRGVLERRYRPRSVVVVHNTPATSEQPAALPDPIRPPLGLDPDTPVALYHGMLAEDRNLLALADAILEPGLERLHLVFLGHGPFRDRLEAHARSARFGGRVHVCPSVGTDVLPAWVHAATVGAMPLPPTTLNLVLSTPNKLWECLAVGTPVLVSNFPAVREIVLNDPAGPLGTTCDPTSIEDIGRGLRTVVELPKSEAARLRRRCLRAARERWNWGAESERLVAAYTGLAAELPGLVVTPSIRAARAMASGTPRWKRALDLGLSAPALPVLGALLVVVWFAMRATGDRGPLLYRAKRIGERHRPITVYKIRTMQPHTAGPMLTAAGDGRITRLGRILRQYKLDELPQLWNVVRGEMSLVGPRPEDPEYVDLTDPLHRFVFGARPGITGRAQLEFRHESDLLDRPDAETFYRSTILPRKLELDRDYLETQSIRADLRVLARTLNVLGSGRSKPA